LWDFLHHQTAAEQTSIGLFSYALRMSFIGQTGFILS